MLIYLKKKVKFLPEGFKGVSEMCAALIHGGRQLVFLRLWATKMQN